MLRILFAVSLGMMLFAGRSWAQEDTVGSSTSALQQVLTTLKQSVEKLSLDNDQLTTRDNAMRQQVLQLQMQLGQLESQGDQLHKAASQLQGNNPRRAQQIARLEQENSDLDNRIQKAEGGIKSVQQSIASGYQEDQKLLLQLKGMSDVLPASPQGPSPAYQASDRHEKEKLKLMKMIYDSEQRQESLHEAIMEFQKNAPLQPATAVLAHQETLKEQIKGLETQIAAYPAEKLSTSWGFANQWDDTQLGRLESELKVLEKNYLQLKDLMDQMTKKAQAARLTPSEHLEEGKLQISIEGLSHQGVGLRADLDDLRAQMVDLDKRKSRLETMIQHMP